ncbi:MAG: hypothetical protein GY937_23620 [bacterium]|nr:hypothetical protein [bacterium]
MAEKRVGRRRGTPIAVAAHTLEREAAALLTDALRQIGVPGARQRHRSQLGLAIDAAQAALATSDGTPEAIAGARSTLVRALAARAEDARHGAGQLSRSAQRAPTREACDDGWRRVEAIVAGAEASASEAACMALQSDDPASREAARTAQAAAQEARRIIEERNHAYTFHADPGFSFGEGWYLAAAASLSNVEIQIEPDQAQTQQAERFLRAAGLRDCLQPYRSRPRANKQLPEIVAQAYRADAPAAQRELRAAFLGDAPIPQRIVDWTDRALAHASTGNKVLLWIRRGAHHPWRNTDDRELLELIQRSLAAELVPVLIGDTLDVQAPSEAVDLTLFWKEPLFQGADMRRAQLQFFEHLRRTHALVGQLGVTTAGMDGPALMGLPTLYLTDAPNVRMSAWVGTVPGYQGLVRGEGYLEDVGNTLKAWADRAS